VPGVFVLVAVLPNPPKGWLVGGAGLPNPPNPVAAGAALTGGLLNELPNPLWKAVFVVLVFPKPVLLVLPNPAPKLGWSGGLAGVTEAEGAPKENPAKGLAVPGALPVLPTELFDAVRIKRRLG
jgi:hypothetical protein